MGANVVLNLAFVGSLLGLGFAGPHAGLAAASAASGWLNAAMLYRGLRKAGVYEPVEGWGRIAIATVAGCVAMAALLLWFDPGLDAWSRDGAWARALHLALLIGAGAACYALVTLASGLRPRLFARGAH
jgi:putative peptidoglycan lipid II flippase